MRHLNRSQSRVIAREMRSDTDFAVMSVIMAAIAMTVAAILLS